MSLLRRGVVRATYRLQLGPELRLRRRARARALPARARASRTCTCRRRCRRGRARRTATTWWTRRGSARRSAARTGFARWPARRARPGWGSCSTSSRTTWRPTERRWRDPAGLRRRRRDRLHRRFFDIDDLLGMRVEDDGGLRGHARARCCGWSPRALVDGLRVDHPTGWPTRRATCGGCASAASSACGWRRSSTPARSCARLAGVRDDRL